LENLTIEGRLILSGISGFLRDVDEICALLAYHRAYSGNSLPMFGDKISVPCSRVNKFLSLLVGLVVSPETSVRNFQPTLRNTPKNAISNNTKIDIK
jgi:hypothetical protein